MTLLTKAPRWIICDIDGTLADSSWRASFLPDWDAFHAASIDDTIFPETVSLLNALAKCSNVALVTGRNERYRGITNKWLIRHGVMYHALYMRPDDDYSKAAAFKTGVYQKFFAGANVWLVLEDDDKAVDAYRTLGLPCHQVRPATIS